MPTLEKYLEKNNFFLKLETLILKQLNKLTTIEV